MSIAPVAQQSLAHPTIDPAPLVARAREALGWSGSDFVVGLQGYAELVATLESAHDLDGLFRIGDPTSPPVRLLRALSSSPSGLRVTRTAVVPQPWRWARCSEGTAAITGVALRQQTYSDVVDVLGSAGVTFRVLPDHATTAEIMAIGATLGSVVVDVDELGEGARLVPGHLDGLPDLTFGLVSREQPRVVDVVWLSMAAAHEAAGTLMGALAHISELGIDLDFLHSDPLAPGRHAFYLGFRADAERLERLQQALDGAGFTSRVLACFGAGA